MAQLEDGGHAERGLAIIPLSHLYGQIVPLLLGLLSGTTLIFLHALTPSAIASTMRREHVTTLVLVPQLVSILLDGIEAEAAKRGRSDQLRRTRSLARVLPLRLRRILFRSVLGPMGGSLSVITTGGARLSVELQEAWESMGVRVIQGYGATECAAIAGHSRGSRRRGTVGRPLAGLEIRLGGDAELLVRGPSVMSGYWQDPEATAEVLSDDGWLHTGDAARIDDHGEIVILGRTRDRIALPNGMKVYPEDIEIALRETDAIRAAVVLEAAPGRLVAALVPAHANADDATLSAAVKAANATLAPHQRVVSWRRWPEDDLPRTHTLKVRRQPVRDWYLEAAAGADAAARVGPRRRQRPGRRQRR